MLCFVFAALVVVLDQFMKHWIVLTLDIREKTAIIPGLIGLTHEENTGAAFSILSDQRWLLVAIAFVAALLIIAILLRYNDGFWGTLGLAAVLGGTVGNLIDRLFNGYVVDMFEFYFVDFAIFNIADIFITLGGILFLVYLIISAFRPSKRSELAADQAPNSYEREDARDNASEQYSDVGEIGLYDFEYKEDDTINRVQKRYGDFSGDDTVTNAYSDQSMATEYTGAGPDGYADEPLDDILSTLEAMSGLESELLGAEILEDYDIDDLLKEYGFEDDAD